LHASSEVPAIADYSLGKIAKDPALPLPALARSLSDAGTQGDFDETTTSLTRLIVSQKTPERLRVASIMALGLMGARAHEAVPALVRTLNDDDEMVQSAATNALLKIAPNVLTNRVKDF
jgi:HEAT repeat protein